MTLTSAREREAFAKILATESEQLNHGALPQWSRKQNGLNAARLLCRHGVTYSRLQALNCNGVGTWAGESNESFQRRQEAFERRLERKEQSLEKRIRQIVAELGPGFGVIFDADPGGCTIKVIVPSGQTNDWGKEGICVPTA